jgi:hypothetical protein
MSAKLRKLFELEAHAGLLVAPCGVAYCHPEFGLLIASALNREVISRLDSECYFLLLTSDADMPLGKCLSTTPSSSVCHRSPYGISPG